MTAITLVTILRDGETCAFCHEGVITKNDARHYQERFGFDADMKDAEDPEAKMTFTVFDKPLNVKEIL